MMNESKYKTLINGKSVDFIPENKKEIMIFAQSIANISDGCIGVATYGWGIGHGFIKLVFK